MIIEPMAIILGNFSRGRFRVMDVYDIPNIKKKISGRFVIYDYYNEYPEFEKVILKNIHNDSLNNVPLYKEKCGRFMIYED